jgi:hypothetical protein
MAFAFHLHIVHLRIIASDFAHCINCLKIYFPHVASAIQHAKGSEGRGKLQKPKKLA